MSIGEAFMMIVYILAGVAAAMGITYGLSYIFLMARYDFVSRKIRKIRKSRKEQ